MTQVANMLNNAQSAISTKTGNISNSKSVGAFAVSGIFLAQQGGAKYIERQELSYKGNFIQTDIASDLSIGDGIDVTGLLVVKGLDGKIQYTTNGSLRKTTNGAFEVADHSQIMGWMLDSTGNLPSNLSTSSLVPLSLQGVTSNAVPTSKVGLIMNLDQSQKNLQGAGGKMNPGLGGILNISNIDSIIIPNDTNNGALHFGDQFRLKAGDRAQDTIFEYGGITASRQIGSASAIFGSITDTGQALPVVQAPTATQISSAYQMSIAIGGAGGSTFTFQASSVSGRTGSGGFSSIADLATAINLTGQLRASINNGRLYIAANNANQSLTFTENNVGTGASLLNVLGIDNVPDSTVLGAKFSGQTVFRFSTMRELQQKINASNQGLIATMNGTGINFSAANPLEQLQLGGRDINARSIYRVTAGFTPTTSNFGTWPQNTVATIQASNNFLNVGDYVRLSGGNGALADGLYKVLTTTADTFVVATKADLAAPNVGAPVGGMPTDGNFTWQKVDGGNSQPSLLNVAAGATCDTQTAAGTATFAGLAGGNAGLQLAVADVVYVQNSNSLQDGYYRVTAPLAGGALGLAIIGGGNQAVTATNIVAQWTNAAAAQAAFLAGTIGAAVTGAAGMNPASRAALYAVPSITASVQAALNFQAVPNSATAQALLTAMQSVAQDAIPGGTIATTISAGALGGPNLGQGNVVAATILAAITAPGAAGVALQAALNAVGTTGNDINGRAHGAAAEGNSLTITKVAGALNFDSFPIETVANTQTVKLHITPGSSYAVNGVIAFRNLTTSPITIGGNLSITGDRYYKVTDVDTVNGIVSFQADLQPNTLVTAVTAGFVGFNSTYIAGAGAVGTIAGTTLGPTSYVDYISDIFNALGATATEGQGQSPITADILNSPLAASYNANDGTRSFSGGQVNQGVFRQTVSIIDSLGESHDVVLAFGKIGNNEWAVEIYLPKQDDGTYDAVTTNPVVPGQLVAGTMTFDGNGQLTSLDGALTEPVVISWIKGATSLPISIDWGAINGLSQFTGLPTTAGITQINGNGTNNVSAITNDGKVPAGINGYRFDESGILYATSANGEIAVGQLAIASFANFNGLTQKNGYLYESADSGQVIYKTAGTDGVDEIITGGVTGSAVNDTQEYMDLIEDSQFMMLGTQVASKGNAAKDFLVRNLG